MSSETGFGQLVAKCLSWAPAIHQVLPDPIAMIAIIGIVCISIVWGILRGVEVWIMLSMKQSWREFRKPYKML